MNICIKPIRSLKELQRRLPGTAGHGAAALSVIVLLSLALKLFIIFHCGNRLTLSSDDLGYYKSAATLIRRGILTYHGYNEPTVFITPLYPLFLAGVLKITGFGFAGIQAIRVIQALMACGVIVIVWLTARDLFDGSVALTASFLVAFYFPNSVTAGYILTETLFTLLLCLLVCFSIVCVRRPSFAKFAILGALWAGATLCRPTVAMYPVLLIPYAFCMQNRKQGVPSQKAGIRRSVQGMLSQLRALRKYVAPAAAMVAVFVAVMTPWWIRNYVEYGTFIPLSAASGNPMLQGTYIGYRQAPGEVTPYRAGKSTYETNAIETQVAYTRMREGFEKDFWRYLGWYTAGKTVCFWGTPFYWKTFLGAGQTPVRAYHYLAVAAGFAGIALLVFSAGFARYMLPVSVIAYFNMIHCVTMAFDRYAFPLMPLLFMFSSVILVRIGRALKYTAFPASI